ncbi:MAG: DUF6172 family protein [Arcobacteraceae bacterium]
MKKTYQLTAENKKPERVVEAIKNDIRKYIKREKRKALPEGMNVWNMECKFAQNDDTPEIIAFQDIMKSIDGSAAKEAKSIYVEIISIAIKKERKIEEEIINDEVVSDEIIEKEKIEENEENQNIEPSNN